MPALASDAQSTKPDRRAVDLAASPAVRRPDGGGHLEHRAHRPSADETIKHAIKPFEH
jgi:hypothetical protein